MYALYENASEYNFVLFFNNNNNTLHCKCYLNIKVQEIAVWLSIEKIEELK